MMAFLAASGVNPPRCHKGCPQRKGIWAEERTWPGLPLLCGAFCSQRLLSESEKFFGLSKPT